MTAAAAPAAYTAAREGAALARLDRGVLAVAGPRRVKFLHGILSNDVESRGPGQGCRAALMDVKGRQLAWMRVLVDASEVLLEVAADRLDVLEERLTHYRVGAPVRFARRPSAVLAVVGPRAPEALERAGAGRADDLVAEAHRAAAIAGRAVRVARAGDMPASGYVVHAAADDAPAVEEALRAAGAAPADRAVLDVLRIEDGRPWHGPDVSEENLLHETGLLGEYHSAAKGCYVGQEVVARLEGRGGNVNKVMRGLRLARPAAAGDPLTADGREVGRITTAGVSPARGPIAMGYVHRGHAAPGTVLDAGGSAATVAELPLGGEG